LPVGAAGLPAELAQRHPGAGRRRPRHGLALLGPAHAVRRQSGGRDDPAMDALLEPHAVPIWRATSTARCGPPEALVAATLITVQSSPSIATVSAGGPTRRSAVVSSLRTSLAA